MRMRTANIGDCLIADQSMGVCPDGSDYLGTLDNGGAAIDISTLPNYAQEAADAGLGPTNDWASASSIATSLSAKFLPTGVKVSSTGLQVPVTCPTGYTAVNGVCSPVAASQIISGVPNWIIYGIGGVLALMLFNAGKR